MSAMVAETTRDVILHLALYVKMQEMSSTLVVQHISIFVSHFRTYSRHAANIADTWSTRCRVSRIVPNIQDSRCKTLIGGWGWGWQWGWGGVWPTETRVITSRTQLFSHFPRFALDVFLDRTARKTRDDKALVAPYNYTPVTYHT